MPTQEQLNSPTIHLSMVHGVPGLPFLLAGFSWSLGCSLLALCREQGDMISEAAIHNIPVFPTKNQ